MMLDELVTELRQVMDFKDTTGCGDLVLVAADKPRLLVYGLVTGIDRDTTRLGDWWHVSMRLLTVPPQNIVWTLRIPQFTGREIFTMGGEERFVQAVDIHSPRIQPEREENREADPSSVEGNPFRRVK